MAKLMYRSPVLRELTPTADPDIPISYSQGTSGDTDQFTWDPRIDENDIEMFWLSYDDTDLAGIDTNDDLYISYEEFMAWYNSVHPW